MHRPELECAPRERIEAHQLRGVNRLLAEVLPRNRFYAGKLGTLALPLNAASFLTLPFTTKAELVADQQESPPLGRIATFDRARYVAYHQTSGTMGRPLVVLDTPESWEWWSECWQYVYRAAGVTPGDRVFLAFSFGPFIGFWSAHAGARRLGALTIPGGGLDTRARLDMIRSTQATVLISTPTYALHLAEVARAEGVSPREWGVRRTIHAGEPGASIPSVRARIEQTWGALCFDHAGATEVGAYGYTCERQDGLHVNEAEFVAEVLDPTTGRAAATGDKGELVLTNLGRASWPVIRYRTGDLVERGGRACACGRTFLKLPGGILGRTDDLMIVRGVNVHPTALEAIVRGFDVEEFRIVRTRRDAMEELALELEAEESVARALAEAVHRGLGLRIEARAVPAGSLPRFELKARRVLDLREADPAQPAEPPA